jgi:integrase
MPSRQRGRIEKLPSGRWSARFYDENGARRRQGGFETKSEAGEWLDRKLDEVAGLRRGDVTAVRRQAMPTLAQLVDEYLEQHSAERNTLRTLRARLTYAVETFGAVRVDRLDPPAVGAWRKRLPERSAWAIHKALRQVLHHAVRIKLIDENPATLIANPEPKRREVPTFESVAELEAVAEELHPRFSPIPVFVGLTGLRPEEWIALERRDVDARNGVVHVRRVFTDGELKQYGKQARSLRAVPLPKRAAAALDVLPARIDTPVLFPGERGGYLNLHSWRADHWTPAVRAAGLTHRPPYALRHTFAAFSVAAGVSLYELARFMGTSVDQIDKTYAHLLPDSLDRTRSALDAFLTSHSDSATNARV